MALEDLTPSKVLQTALNYIDDRLHNFQFSSFGHGCPAKCVWEDGKLNIYLDRSSNGGWTLFREMTPQDRHQIRGMFLETTRGKN